MQRAMWEESVDVLREKVPRVTIFIEQMSK